MFSSTLLTYTTTFLKMSQANFSALMLMWTLESAACLGLVQPFLVREVGEIATLQVSFACMIVFYVLFSLLTADNSSYASCLHIGGKIAHWPLHSCHCLTRPRLSHSFGPLGAAKAFVIMILFAMGSITYPLAVSLATREVPPELQGGLQGAATWVCFFFFSYGFFKVFTAFFQFFSYFSVFFKLLFLFMVPGAR